MKRTTLAWTALALAVLLLALAEQDRPWKRLQAEYRELELAALRARLDAEGEQNEPAARQLEAELKEARQRFAERRDDVRPLEKQLRAARHSARWAGKELERLRRSSAISGDGLREARERFEEARRAELDLERRLAEMRSEISALEARRAGAAERLAALERRIAELERGVLWRLVPGLRGLDPTLSVVEVAPRESRGSSNGGRVDRCMTCHLGAGEGAAGAPEAAAWSLPFAPHPGGLVGEGSPHPTRLFGCTACHGGEGRATEFSRAGHWPSGAAQEAEWVERWGYSRAALPPRPIRPPSLVEAGCVPCHEDASWKGAGAASGGALPALGRQLVLQMGCAGCHAGGAEKRGPPLGKLAAKTTPGWAFRWIEAPRRFRATTWMPHLFAADADPARRAAEIRALVVYLWSRAEIVEDQEEMPDKAGDAEAGGELFAAVGCRGCHTLDVAAARGAVALERLHGPNLARTGSKVRAAWLYAWLRDPRRHRPDTPMPSLRLTRREAADLTAYLMASRDPDWDALELPRLDATTRDDLVLEYLEEESTLAESTARLAVMTGRDKDLYLGKRGLEAYGCNGCHDIPGLEEASPAAGPLAELARDPRRLLRAGSVRAVAHSRRPAGPSGKRAAPDYDLGPREADAVLVDLLGRTPPPSGAPRAAPEERARVLTAGRRLVARYGCLGCHRLEGRGGAIAAAGAGARLPGARLPGARPPDLTAVGARLQSPWLFSYLRDPGEYRRRSWLTVRMPTFHLRPEEANALVRFFAALDGQPLFTDVPPKLEKRQIEVGRAVVAMLRCQSCHADSADAAELAPAELAPSYRGARRRLRPGWVVDWILDPRLQMPETRMPAVFARDERGVLDSSYLTATISAPMFSTERARLLPLFESEEELAAYLEDAPRVAVALRDYLWSLDSDE